MDQPPLPQPPSSSALPGPPPGPAGRPYGDSFGAPPPSAPPGWPPAGGAQPGGAPPAGGPPPGPPPGAPDPGHTPLAPSSRRLLRLVALLALLLIAVVAIHAAHGGGGAGGDNPMVEAAQKTAEISGAKMAMEVTYSAEGSSTVIVGTGSGSYNAKSGISQANLSVPIPGHGTLSMESVATGRVVYMRSPMFAGHLPPGTEWLGVEPLLGRSEETAFGSDGSPQSSMQMMQAVGSVEKLDQQTVRGHLTTRYKGDVDISKAADFLADNGEKTLAKEYEAVAEGGTKKVEFEAWVDSRGLARQLREVVQLPAVDGHSLTMDMRMQLYDFGAKPRIELPSKHLVLDKTPMVRAELGLVDGHSIGSLQAAAGAKPLSTSVFRRRATAICHRVAGEGLRLERAHVGLLERAKSTAPGSLTLSEARPFAEAYGVRLGEPIYRVLRHGTLDLARLRPPAADAGAYRRYLELDAQQAEWLLAQARALRLGAFKTPAVSRKAEARREAAERQKLATKLGIGSCEKTSVAAPTTAA